MMIEIEPSFLNRAGRWNDKSARGHETALSKWDRFKKKYFHLKWNIFKSPSVYYLSVDSDISKGNEKSPNLPVCTA